MPPAVAGYGAESAKLTFSITNDYPSKVLETDASGFRAIGKRGAVTVYAINATRMDGRDFALADRVKGEAIRLLLERGAAQNPGEGLTFAYNTCLGLLSGSDTSERKEMIAYLVAHDIAGNGPIGILSEDAINIEEVEVNAHDDNITIYHSKYGRCTTNLKFNSEKDFRFIMNRLIATSGRELNASSPIVDAQLFDGSRIHAQLKPYAIRGAAASIRFNGSRSIDIQRLMKLGTARPDVLAYVWMAIEAGLNIVVSGAPASGKTSLLVAINAFAPPHHKIVTIEEDVNELKFYNNFMHVVSLQGSNRADRLGIREQVINALRLRPDRLIIGEIRGAEANEVFAGANLGIPFMTTMHSAGDGASLIGRLVAKPMSVQEQNLNMLDASIFMRHDGFGHRTIDGISEYDWLSRDEVSVDDVPQAQKEGFSIRPIVKGGAMDGKAVHGSKALREYSRRNMCGMTAAQKEFRRRVGLLKGIVEGKGASSAYDMITAHYTGE
jgi:Flp pilus assembly CpaF family ATPase